MKQDHCTQLGQKERDRIFLFKKKSMSQSGIAARLGRSKSTIISRELKRNVHRKLHQCLPDTAQRKADKRKEHGRKQRYVDNRPKLKKRIVGFLEKGWSPDLIAGRFKQLKQPYLNQESIYQFIYSLQGRKQNLRHHLRRAHRIRLHKGGRTARKDSGIPHRVDISKRPKIVEKRTEFGHWEGDNVVYNRHRRVLATSVERKTRKVVISKPKDLTAKTKVHILIRRYRLPETVEGSASHDDLRQRQGSRRPRGRYRRHWHEIFLRQDVRVLAERHQ